MHEELRGDRHASLQLLITKDQTEALDLATYLNAKNIERQTLLDRHLEEATAKVVAQEENLCMVAFDPSWSTGVIGLVAGRLLEQYKRPVIVLAPEDGVIKGSVRSVDGADTLSLLTAAEEVLERYGGHAKAGGLTMKKGETPERLCELVNLWMQKEGFSLESMKASCLRSPDLDVTLPDVDVNLAKELRLLEPFGMGFPTPLFHGEYSVANIRKVGSEKQHLSCVLEGDGASKKAIAFRYKGLDLEPNHPYSAYYTISLDEWNGQEQISCHIQRIEEL
jgi:single-stranded-DNA-specific exonuclease